MFCWKKGKEEFYKDKLFQSNSQCQSLGSQGAEAGFCAGNRRRSESLLCTTFNSVCLHAQSSQATVKAQLGHLIGPLSLSQYTSTEGQSIYCPTPLQQAAVCLVQLAAVGLPCGLPKKLPTSSQAASKIHVKRVKHGQLYSTVHFVTMPYFRCTLPLSLTGFLLSSRPSSTNLCCSNSGSKTPLGLIRRRMLWPVRVQLRCIHASFVSQSHYLGV